MPHIDTSHPYCSLKVAMDDAGTPTSTAIKDERSLNSKKTTVIIYQPTIHSIDLTECCTFEDVLRTITRHSGPIRSDPDVFVNRVRPGAVPGARWAKEDLADVRKNWSDHYFPDLNVLPVLRSKYTVRVVDSRQVGEPGRLPSFEVKVKSTDTVADLKKRIQEHTGISPSSQRLDSEGTVLSADKRLIVLGIDGTSRISLTVAISLWFEFPQMSLSTPTFAQTPLRTILRLVSNANQPALTPTLFQISHSSGQVAPVSKEWLPERSCVFTAEDAVGMVRENGLRVGDRIRVVELTKNAPATRECNRIWTKKKLLRGRDRLRKAKRRLLKAGVKRGRSLKRRDKH